MKRVRSFTAAVSNETAAHLFTGIANAALSLISDGGTWFETGRSPIG